jgi:hypothetical protein
VPSKSARAVDTWDSLIARRVPKAASEFSIRQISTNAWSGTSISCDRGRYFVLQIWLWRHWLGNIVQPMYGRVPPLSRALLEFQLTFRDWYG